MSKTTTLFIGLDVHKDSISVAYAKDERGSEVVFVGQIGPRHSDLGTLVRRLQSHSSRLVFAYEAGPCGNGLFRYFAGKQLQCPVVALVDVNYSCLSRRLAPFVTEWRSDIGVRAVRHQLARAPLDAVSLVNSAWRTTRSDRTG